MNSDLLRLNSRDFLTALANAVFAAIVVALFQLVTAGGFDLFSADWAAIIKSIINSSFIVLISSLGMALGIDKNGKILGSI